MIIIPNVVKQYLPLLSHYGQQFIDICNQRQLQSLNLTLKQLTSYCEEARSPKKINQDRLDYYKEQLSDVIAYEIHKQCIICENFKTPAFVGIASGRPIFFCEGCCLLF